MHADDIKVLFFGSGSFVMPIVENLAKASLLSGIVVTKPKARGRGLKVSMPEIAQWAQNKNIRVYTPVDPNAATFILEVQALEPWLFVLCSYGYILGESLLRVPRYGGINIHPSLLPKYRGAAPIQRVLMNGEETTGVTIIIMDEKVDHGDIILQRELAIDPDDTYGSLSARLSQLGAALIVDAVNQVVSSRCLRTTQRHAGRTLAPKIQKQEMIIDWRKGTREVYNLIRALVPHPGAHTTFRGRDLRILKASRCERKWDAGVVGVEGKKVRVGTGDGSIILQEVQPESKSVISSVDFINGYRVESGEVMG